MKKYTLPFARALVGYLSLSRCRSADKFLALSPASYIQNCFCWDIQFVNGDKVNATVKKSTQQQQQQQHWQLSPSSSIRYIVCIIWITQRFASNSHGARYCTCCHRNFHRHQNSDVLFVCFVFSLYFLFCHIHRTLPVFPLVLDINLVRTVIIQEQQRIILFFHVIWERSLVFQFVESCCCCCINYTIQFKGKRALGVSFVRSCTVVILNLPEFS